MATETKYSSVCIDMDMLEVIKHCIEQLRRVKGISFNTDMMRLKQSQTGIGPATDLLVPISFEGQPGTPVLNADIIFNVTDYSKF